MSDRIRRDANGHFASGQSGNPEGARLRKAKELLTIEDLHRIHLEVVGEIVGRTRSGKPVTRYENITRSLVKGEAGSRLAAKDTLELSQRAAWFFDAADRRAALNRRRS